MCIIPNFEVWSTTLRLASVTATGILRSVIWFASTWHCVTSDCFDPCYFLISKRNVISCCSSVNKRLAYAHFSDSMHLDLLFYIESFRWVLRTKPDLQERARKKADLRGWQFTKSDVTSDFVVIWTKEVFEEYQRFDLLTPLPCPVNKVRLP
jgi:hypothetical protein